MNWTGARKSISDEMGITPFYVFHKRLIKGNFKLHEHNQHHQVPVYSPNKRIVFIIIQVSKYALILTPRLHFRHIFKIAHVFCSLNRTFRCRKFI